MIRKVKKMNDVEKRFYDEFSTTMDLVIQPNILKHSIVFYRADFLDNKTGVYYEVIASRQTFYTHKHSGHFDFIHSKGKKLVLAIYFKRKDFFFLVNYDPKLRCTQDYFNELILRKQYSRNYGDAFPVFTVIPEHKFIAVVKMEKEKRIAPVDVEVKETVFNSSLERKEYNLLKIDAARKGLTVRSLISSILSTYVKKLRKEGLSLGETKDLVQTELDLQQ